MAKISRNQILATLLAISAAYEEKNNAVESGRKYVATYRKASGNTIDVEGILQSISRVELEKKQLRDQSEELIKELTKHIGRRFGMTNHVITKEEKKDKYVLLVEDLEAQVLKNRLSKHDYPDGVFALILEGEKKAQVLPFNEEFYKLLGL